MSKKSDQPPPFNNAFSALKALKKEEPKGKPAPARVVAPPPKKRSTDEDDAALFLESLGEVEPVKVKIARVAPTAPRSVDELRTPTEEAESLARLAELVSGEGEFDLSDSDRLTRPDTLALPAEWAARTPSAKARASATSSVSCLVNVGSVDTLRARSQ